MWVKNGGTLSCSMVIFFPPLQLPRFLELRGKSTPLMMNLLLRWVMHSHSKAKIWFRDIAVIMFFFPNQYLNCSAGKEAYQAKELSIPHYILIVGDYALKQENEISFLHEREIYRTLIIMRRTQPLIGHMHAYCLPSMTFCRLLVSKFVDRLCEGGTSVTFLNENQ